MGPTRRQIFGNNGPGGGYDSRHCGGQEFAGCCVVLVRLSRQRNAWEKRDHLALPENSIHVTWLKAVVPSQARDLQCDVLGTKTADTHQFCFLTYTRKWVPARAGSCWVSLPLLSR